MAAHQPEYLPYLGFFYKMIRCDKFVILDNVQFSKEGWQNRNRIRSKQDYVLLTVPVLSKNNFGQPINEVRINNKINWQKKHWLSIYYNYNKTPFFEEYQDFFDEIYNAKKWEKLIDINEAIIDFIVRELNINVEIIRASNLNPSGQKNEILIDLCNKTGADVYYSGEGARQYLIESEFDKNNISVKYTDFSHPIYQQQSDPFLPNTSIIDLLFNHGGESGLEILNVSND